MKINNIFKVVLSLGVLFVLTGCSVNEHGGIGSKKESQPSSEVSKDSVKKSADLVQAAADMDLPVEAVKSLTSEEINKYPAQIENATEFKNGENKMIVFVVKSSDDATKLVDYLADQGQKVKSDPSQKIVLTSDRTMALGWFNKYRKAIFLAD